MSSTDSAEQQPPTNNNQESAAPAEEVSENKTEQQLASFAEVSPYHVSEWIRAHRGVCREVWTDTLISLARQGIIDVDTGPESYQYFRVTLVAYILRFSRDRYIAMSTKNNKNTAPTKEEAEAVGPAIADTSGPTQTTDA